MPRPSIRDERRRFLHGFGAQAALLLASCASTRDRKPHGPAPGEKPEEGVTPTEDLMREHGVLERALLVYEECARRLEAQEPAPAEVLGKSAGLVRRFIEDYHERLEEEFLFPRFEAARREVELVRVLRAQHERGRTLTADIAAGAEAAGASKAVNRPALAGALRAFSRMVRPHAAREDTVLFPALKELLPASAFRDLGERFEDREHALFGERGFEGAVGEVAVLEQSLGIGDLSLFTPRESSL